MPTAQPDMRVVQDLLARHFAHVHSLVPLNMGQTVLAYAFVAADQSYILRLSAASIIDRLRRERLIAEYFASDSLPIPAIVAVGEYVGFEYGISVQAPGHALESLPRPHVVPYIPAILAVSDAMCRADVSRTVGYGWLDDRAQGQFPTWADSLRALIDENPDDGFYGRWHGLFENGLLPRDLFQQGYQAMLDLLPFCPEDRYLVHGNFRLSNLIGQHNHITGVVEWTDAFFGDFVFDIASLVLWYPDLDFASYFAAHITRQGLSVPNLDQRLRCYQLYIGLDALRFFAKQNHPQMLNWTQERLLAILPA